MLGLTLCLICNALLFYSFGFFISRRHGWVVAILSNCLVGYLIFWAYYFSPDVGKMFSIAWIATAIWGLRYEEVRKNIFSRPLFLTLLIGGFYVALLDPSRSLLQSIQQRFLEAPFPQDNEFAYIFADKLMNHADLGVLISPYLSSDRPPLQTGMVLLAMPVLGNIFGSVVHYQAISMVLQLTWVVAFCAHGWRLAPLILAFCGFFFVNSSYVWPKLFAGVLGLFALQLWKDHKLKLSAVSFGFAMLTHSGVIFVLPVFAFLRKFRWQEWWIGTATVFLLYFPWICYQQLSVPPGNYVAKDLLAGVQSTERQSTWRAMANAYSKMSFTEIWQHKKENFLTLWTPRSGNSWKNAEDWRYSEFFHLARVFGVLGILIVFLRGRIAIGVLMSFLLWCLALYGPGTAVVHHTSFSLILILFWILLEKLRELPVYLRAGVIGVQVFQFFYLWGAK